MFEKSCFLVESILDCKVTNILSLIDRKDVIFFEPFKHIQERTSYSLIQKSNCKPKDLFIISLDCQEKRLKILKFDENDRQDNLSFLGLELDEERINSVIINGASIAKIKRAYPNYFLDAQNFIKNIQVKLK